MFKHFKRSSSPNPNPEPSQPSPSNPASSSSQLDPRIQSQLASHPSSHSPSRPRQHQPPPLVSARSLSHTISSPSLKAHSFPSPSSRREVEGQYQYQYQAGQGTSVGGGVGGGGSPVRLGQGVEGGRDWYRERGLNYHPPSSHSQVQHGNAGGAGGRGERGMGSRMSLPGSSTGNQAQAQAQAIPSRQQETYVPFIQPQPHHLPTTSQPPAPAGSAHLPSGQDSPSPAPSPSPSPYPPRLTLRRGNTGTRTPSATSQSSDDEDEGGGGASGGGAGVGHGHHQRGEREVRDFVDQSFIAVADEGINGVGGINGQVKGEKVLESILINGSRGKEWASPPKHPHAVGHGNLGAGRRGSVTHSVRSNGSNGTAGGSGNGMERRMSGLHFEDEVGGVGRGRGAGRGVEEVLDGEGEGEEEGEKRSVADDLPPEIILQVLKNLPSTRDLLSTLLVSRTWCQCTVPSIWAKPHLTTDNSLRKIIRVLRQSAGLSRLYQNGTIFNYPLMIRRLNFTPFHGKLIDDQLVQFMGCARMERLTLAGNGYLTPAGIGKAISGMTELMAVDFSGTKANDEVLQVLAKSAKGIQGINLTNCPGVTTAGLLAVSQHSKMLRRLKLVNCDSVTEEAISALAKRCPNILELDLEGVSQVSDSAMIDVWLNTSQLRELSLIGAMNINEQGFPRLKALTAVNDHQVETPKDNPEAWETFNLRLRAPPVTNTFTFLRTVDLQGCMNLTDEAINSLVWNAPKIRSLTLAKCPQLTDASLESICRLEKNLHYIHLGHVNQVTDWGVCRMARACTRLKYVDLACAALLTDMSVFELATNLPRLQRVGLVKVVNLTDEAIYALVDRNEKGAPNLERIHLSYCDNISVKAVTYLLKRVPRITHVSLTGVSAFRQPEFQRYCRPAPKEFNAHQRAAFCVFSGKGVADLRTMLILKENPGLSPDSKEFIDLIRGHGQRNGRRASAMARLGSSPNVNVPAVEGLPIPMVPMGTADSMAIFGLGGGSAGPDMGMGMGSESIVQMRMLFPGSPPRGQSRQRRQQQYPNQYLGHHLPQQQQHNQNRDDSLANITPSTSMMTSQRGPDSMFHSRLSVANRNPEDEIASSGED